MSGVKNKVFSVDYRLSKETANGELIETTEGKQPLVFLSGWQQMIPEFEANVTKLAVGEKFSFGIKAANAYGVRTEEAIIDLPKDMFMRDGKMAEEVVAGNMVPLQDDHGNVHQAIVTSINENSVTVDVNHPLADQDLYFEGNVVAIRDATEEEISHGHVHGPGGHQH